MNRTKPHGRTRLLRGTTPVAEPLPPAEPDPRAERPRADTARRPPVIPGRYGRIPERVVEAWRRECLRRSGVEGERNKERWGE